MNERADKEENEVVELEEKVLMEVLMLVVLSRG